MPSTDVSSFFDRADQGQSDVSPYFDAAKPSDVSSFFDPVKSTNPNRDMFLPLVHKAEYDNNLPSGLLDSVIRHESGYNPNNPSPKGAIGLGQLMPDTARGLGVNPYDPVQNINGSARFLSQQLQAFGNDVPKALAAYNAGPGNVHKYGGIPPFAETQNYVKSIMADVYPNGTYPSAQKGTMRVLPQSEFPQPQGGQPVPNVPLNQAEQAEVNKNLQAIKARGGVNTGQPTFIQRVADSFTQAGQQPDENSQPITKEDLLHFTPDALETALKSNSAVQTKSGGVMPLADALNEFQRTVGKRYIPTTSPEQAEADNFNMLAPKVGPQNNPSPNRGKDFPQLVQEAYASGTKNAPDLSASVGRAAVGVLSSLPVFPVQVASSAALYANHPDQWKASIPDTIGSFAKSLDEYSPNLTPEQRMSNAVNVAMTVFGVTHGLGAIREKVGEIANRFGVDPASVEDAVKKSAESAPHEPIDEFKAATTENTPATALRPQNETSGQEATNTQGVHPNTLTFPQHSAIESAFIDHGPEAAKAAMAQHGVAPMEWDEYSNLRKESKPEPVPQPGHGNNSMPAESSQVVPPHEPEPIKTSESEPVKPVESVKAPKTQPEPIKASESPVVNTSDYLALKNADIAGLLQNHDLPIPPDAPRHTVDQWIEDSKGVNVDQLANELRDTNRSIQPHETIAILNEVQRLEKMMGGDLSPADRMDVANRMMDLADLAKTKGSETGRSLVARRVALSNSGDLSYIMSYLKGDGPLTPKIVEDAKMFSDKLKENQQLQDASAQRDAQAALEAELAKHKAENERLTQRVTDLESAKKQLEESQGKFEERQAGRQARKQNYAKDRQASIDNLKKLILGDQASAGIDPAKFAEAAKEIKNIAVSYIREGVDNLGELTDKVRTTLEQNKIMGITDRQIHDSLSGYGLYDAKTPTEAQSRLVDLTRLARLSSQVEDALNGITKPVGKKMYPDSDAVKTMRQTLNEIKKSQESRGESEQSQAGQLRDKLQKALDAIGKEQEEKSTKPEPSPEIKQLRDQIADARKQGRLTKDINEFQRQLSSKDFPGKQSKEAKYVSPETIKLQGERKSLMDQIDEYKDSLEKKRQYELKTPIGKFAHLAWNTFNGVTRSANLLAHFSMFLKQGAHALKGGYFKEYGQAVPMAFKGATGGDKFLYEQHARFENDPDWGLMKDAGFDGLVGKPHGTAKEMDELFTGDFSGRIPFFKRAVESASGTFNGFNNELRFALMKTAMRVSHDPEYLKDMVQAIGRSTGRSLSNEAVRATSSNMNKLMFSARYTVTKLEHAVTPFKDINTQLGKREVAKYYGRLFAGYGVILGALSSLGGTAVLDPMDKHCGMVRLGDTWYNVMGDDVEAYKLLQTVLGTVNEGKYRQDGANVLGQYIMNKTTPAVRSIQETFTGQFNDEGQRTNPLIDMTPGGAKPNNRDDFSVKRELSNLLVPISFKSPIENYDQGQSWPSWLLPTIGGETRKAK